MNKTNTDFKTTASQPSKKKWIKVEFTDNATIINSENVNSLDLIHMIPIRPQQ